jgi:hypothetical protein
LLTPKGHRGQAWAGRRSYEGPAAYRTVRDDIANGRLVRAQVRGWRHPSQLRLVSRAPWQEFPQDAGRVVQELVREEMAVSLSIVLLPAGRADLRDGQACRNLRFPVFGVFSVALSVTGTVGPY